MRFKLAVAISMVVATINHTHAAPNLDAGIWLADLQQSEEMVGVAIRTGDVSKLRRQEVMLTKIISRGDAALAQYDLNDKFKCTHASGDLRNVILDIKIPPALALTALRRVSKNFHENISKCEKLMGFKRKRQLSRPNEW